MNIAQLHTNEKPVSAVSLFKATEGNVIAIHIKQGEELKEHITKVPALLVCVQGKAVFHNEKEQHTELLPGDYVQIEPLIKHHVNGIYDSQLVLIK